MGGVQSCETARSAEVSVGLRWKTFWTCRCVCWRPRLRVEPDEQAAGETSRRSDGADVVMFQTVGLCSGWCVLVWAVECVRGNA